MIAMADLADDRPGVGGWQIAELAAAGNGPAGGGVGDGAGGDEGPEVAGESWRSEARCRQLPEVDKRRFHSPDAVDEDFARWVCSGCPAGGPEGPCLAMAMDDRRLYGVYAGTTYRERWKKSEPGRRPT